MKFESDLAVTVFFIKPKSFNNQIVRFDLDLWPTDPKAVHMWSLKVILKKN